MTIPKRFSSSIYVVLALWIFVCTRVIIVRAFHTIKFSSSSSIGETRRLLSCSTTTYNAFPRRRRRSIQKSNSQHQVAASGAFVHYRPSNIISLLLAAESSSPWISSKAASSNNKDDDDETSTSTSSNINPRRIIKSQIMSIRSHNLAGIVGVADNDNTSSSNGAIGVDFPILGRISDGDNDDDGDDFDKEQPTRGQQQGRPQKTSLIACTGETGTGKTLLMVRVAELLAGGKAPATLLAATTSSSSSSSTTTSAANSSSSKSAIVEMTLLLAEPHFSAVQQALMKNISMGGGASPTNLVTPPPSPSETYHASIGFLHLKRTISLVPSSSTSSGGGGGGGGSSGNRLRIKSTCHVNGQVVPLKFLAALTSSLLTIVDASSAASALARAETRLSILDTAISSSSSSSARLLFAQASQSRARYRQCRLERERLQEELARRVLPASFSRRSTSANSGGGDDDDDDDKDVELLNHWIDELDAFQTRVETFVKALGMESDGMIVSPSDSSSSSSSRLNVLRNTLMNADWMDDSSYDNNKAAGHQQPFSSTLYECLQELRNVILTLDNQLIAAQNAAMAIASLSTMESAATAVQRAREFLFAASSSFEKKGTIFSGSGSAATKSLSSSSSQLDDDTRLSEAAEKSHDHLNQVEEKIKQCARYLEDDDRGLICTLENLRSAWPFSVEQCDEILSYWNFLARKHGIPPKTLPSCHKALISERDGNVEALTLLPRAIAAEKEALTEFEVACADLTYERKAIAQRLSASVNERLPSLGMETSTFRVEVNSERRKCTDASVFASSNPVLGVDVVDFILMKGTPGESPQFSSGDNVNRGGPVHETASLGEKSRILLAIECVVAGAVGAACGNQKIGVETIDCLQKLPPVAVLYDEIDAHVGGRAAVSVAKILAEQSQRSQVLAITHSPSVAAMASLHVVVQKVPVDNNSNNNQPQGSSSPIRMMIVNGADKRKELARMASGDMIPDAAEAFAEALIQDARKKQL